MLRPVILKRKQKIVWYFLCSVVGRRKIHAWYCNYGYNYYWRKKISNFDGRLKLQKEYINWPSWSKWILWDLSKLIKFLESRILSFSWCVLYISAGSGASGHSASWGRTNQPTSPPYESHLHSLVRPLFVNYISSLREVLKRHLRGWLCNLQSHLAN